LCWLRAAVIQPIKQQFVRGVRVVAEIDLLTEEHHLAFAKRGDRRAPVGAFCSGPSNENDELSPVHGVQNQSPPTRLAWLAGLT
jgi:hypothetical protein